MSSASLGFSPRLTRAAVAERERLGARLRTAKAKVRDRKSELAGAEAEVSDLEARLAGLAHLVEEEPAEGSGSGGSLRGQMIRAAAIQVLIVRGPDSGPIHYRRWLALVEAEFGPVAGKRPEAVFLSQVTRHPLVRATTRRGFYEFDLGATKRLEGEIGELRRSLASAAAADAAELPEVSRGGSAAVSLKLTRAERALSEVREALLT